MNKTTLIAAVFLTLASAAASAAEAGSPFTLSLAATRAQTRFSCPTGHCDVYTNGATLTAGYDMLTSTLWPGSQLISSLELSNTQSGNFHTNFGKGVNYPMTDSFRSTAVFYKATLRESEALSIHARVGMAHAVTKTDYVDDSVKHSSNRLAAGLGFSYAIDGHWSVNADIDRTKADFGASKLQNVNQMSVGMGYRF
jgi:outer membrane autotransporter protein